MQRLGQQGRTAAAAGRRPRPQAPRLPAPPPRALAAASGSRSLHSPAGPRQRRPAGPHGRPPAPQQPQRPPAAATAAAHKQQAAPIPFTGGEPWYRDELAVNERWRIRDKGEREYWAERADKLTKASARDAVAKLDLGLRLGLPATLPKSPGKSAQVLGYMWFKRARSRDPMAVALIRMGAFYECVGLDAALLMEYGGLNPMGGGGGGIPRAGAPENNVHQLLRQLVDAGLSVAVWEENPLPDKLYGAKSAQKSRRFVQLVTPENPTYLHGYAESSADRAVEAPTLTGVAWSSSGMSVFRLNRTSNVVEVFHGLSEDGMWGLITADCSTPPVVFLHRPFEAPQHTVLSHATDQQRDFFDLKRRLQDADVRVTAYGGADPLAAFKAHVAKVLQWDTSKEIPHLPAWSATTWPGVRPLYQSTQQQLGLQRTRGIPGLVDALLPDDAPKPVRDVLSSLLMSPPPHSVAASTRQAVRLLVGMDQPLPAYQASGTITPKKVSLVLQEGEANEKFFQALAAALAPIVTTLEQGRPQALAALVDAAWPLLCHCMAVGPERLTQQRMLEAVQAALAAIDEVVADTSAGQALGLGSSSSSGGEDGGSDDEAPAAPSSGGPGGADLQEHMAEFMARLERFRGRVKDDAIREQVDKLDIAYEQVFVVMEGLLRSLRQPPNDPRAGWMHGDEPNSAVWLSLRSRDKRVPVAKAAALDLFVNRGRVNHNRQAVWEPWGGELRQDLRVPYDRNGARLKKPELRTCNALDQVLGSYRAALNQASNAATEALRQLAGRLSAHRLELAAAVQLGVLLAALVDHSRAAKRSGWTVPAVGAGEQRQLLPAADTEEGGGGDDGSGGGRGAFALRGVWPYWMAGSDPATVKNDVRLGGFMLLTGPNMAGKSTVLRAVAAAALCGSVGLAIPAAAGSRLPELDAVMLRTFSGDAPQQRLSAYGVEMREMTFVLDDVQPGSLVLVDELGKGTEVIWGTAIASSILRQLVASGASGIFATHLHLLLDLLKEAPGLQEYRMEVVPADAGATPAAAAPTAGAAAAAAQGSGLVPTMRLLPGYCTASLALDVARQQGLPDSVLLQAQRDFEELRDMGSHDALIRAAAGQLQGNISRSGGPGEGGASSSKSRSSSKSSPSSSGGIVGGGSGSSSSSSSSTADSTHHEAATVAGAVGDKPLEGAAESSAGRIGRRLRGRGSRSSSTGGGSSSLDPTASQEQAQREQQRVQQVTRMLRQVVSGVPLDPRTPLSAEPQPPLDAGGGAGAAARPGVVHHLPPGGQPPPTHEGAPVVYAVRYADGVWYVGESEDIRKRTRQHRRRRGAATERVDVWYAVVGAGQAREELQGRLIKGLADAGVPMLSTYDAHYARKK